MKKRNLVISEVIIRLLAVQKLPFCNGLNLQCCGNFIEPSCCCWWAKPVL